ncbi:MAG: hypothetical protein OIF50_14565, partial [Flavobacteriaceae bacterium]|nr:hypothetical protein [Flavobacteriaceae bacterium]
MLNNLPKFVCIVLCTVICFSIEAQHQIKMDATLREDMKTIMIQQSIRFENNTEKQLEVLYFNDWNNAYASRKSPLTIRLTEEFKKNLFLARNKDKGNTCINGLHSSEQGALHWDYLEVGDIIAVRLKQPLAVGEAINLHWDYEVKIPNAKFTGYGYHTSGYNLRYWYI